MLTRQLIRLPARRTVYNFNRGFTSTVNRYQSEKQQQPPQQPPAQSQSESQQKKSNEPKKKGGFWKTTGKLLLTGTIFGLGYMGWSIYDITHPRSHQLPQDPSKKTLVILGSGWGSVSLLKKIDTSNYNVIVVSPRNFFLFTPLLPACTTGTVEHRSIMEPIRGIIRNKQSDVTYYEAHATKVDHERRVVQVRDAVTENREEADTKEIPFDYLVVGVGAQNSTFGIPGVQDHACFLKEIPDAQKIRKKIMNCIEAASFKNMDDEDRKRLLHTVVVGGGPTGVEFSAELQDFFEDDLKKWVPDIAKDFKVTLVEALPNVLPSFSKQLIDYTERTMKQERISILTKTMVKKVTEDSIVAEATNPDGSKEMIEMPYGLLVWATGNAVRNVTRDLMSSIPAQKNSRRGLLVNEYLVVEGTEGIWALGDCTATKYAPTAQVASQQGSYLGGLFNQLARAEEISSEVTKLQDDAQKAENETEQQAVLADLESKKRRLKRAKSLLPYHYSHQGSLSYIGSDRAVADLAVWGDGNFATGGRLTYLFWRSAYISMCFSVRNKLLVILDWTKVKLFGRDVSRE